MTYLTLFVGKSTYKYVLIQVLFPTKYVIMKTANWKAVVLFHIISLWEWKSMNHRHNHHGKYIVNTDRNYYNFTLAVEITKTKIFRPLFICISSSFHPNCSLSQSLTSTSCLTCLLKFYRKQYRSLDLLIVESLKILQPNL